MQDVNIHQRICSERKLSVLIFNKIPLLVCHRLLFCGTRSSRKMRKYLCVITFKLLTKSFAEYLCEYLRMKILLQ